MGTQNLNNYNFNKIDAKLNYSSYYDFFLTSDEKDFNSEVVWSTKIIGDGDTSVLPVWIDLNDPTTSTQPLTTCAAQYPVSIALPQLSPPFTIISKIQWLSAQTICDCTSAFVKKICDTKIGETARTNGLYDDANIANLQLSPPQDCVEIYKTLPVISTFNKLHFDKRFKMTQVKAYGLTNPPNYWTDTTILNAVDASGYYQELKGGFYQGFYKLHQYDYQILPTRPNKGWSFSTYLKINTIGSNINNHCYNTSGYNFLSATTLCSNPVPGTTSLLMPTHLINYSWKHINQIKTGQTNNGGFFFFKGLRQQAGARDAYSNALGFRIDDDMRIGYRTIRFTGDCVDGGTECKPDSNWECGWGLEESYSDPICPFISLSGNCAETWLQVDVVFDRNLYLEDCDLLNEGGINDLVEGPYSYSADNVCDTFDPGSINLDCSANTIYHWFNEKKYRMGTLKFYVNGRVVHTVNDYEEIIPRHTNLNRKRQFGLPYNMSWGGGAWGFRESNKPVAQQNDLISKYFAGSFIGGISQMMYYLKPLTADEVYHNFLINKERYSLIDCEECENCPGGCPPCELPDSGGGEDPPVECLVHSWSYCSSAWDATPGLEDAFAQQFSAMTNITFVDPTLPNHISGGSCENINSNQLWQTLGQPQVGDSLAAHYWSQNTNPNLYYNWVCFTYQGLVNTTIQQTVVNINLDPPFTTDELVSWGLISGGTAFENCCVCTDNYGVGCAQSCTSGCTSLSALNYDYAATCDCSGVVGGFDYSCCNYNPPCLPGCTDITATNYDGNANCDCSGVMGGTDYSCCVYTGPCIEGCTDVAASNYNPLSTCDCSGVVGGTNYGCCIYTPCISGCTDIIAFNYNSGATCDCLGIVGGTGTDCCDYCPCNVTLTSEAMYHGVPATPGNFLGYQIVGSWQCTGSHTIQTSWTNPTGSGMASATYISSNGGSETQPVVSVNSFGDGTYTFGIIITSGGAAATTCTVTESITITTPVYVSGCTDNTATNYDSSAVIDDGSCVYATTIPGCTNLGSFGYNPIATSDCSGVVGGTDYSCCQTNCNICATNTINGAWNVGLLNSAPFGWNGGAFDSAFSYYYENDTTVYNGCCYLCGIGNVGPYFECSDFATYGAPDTNTAWLSCCPNACDAPCESGCTQTIPSPGTGNCVGTTFGTTATGTWDTAAGPIGNPTDSSVMDYFIDSVNGNQNTIITGVHFEIPRILLPNNFNLDCTGCNGPSTSDGSTVIWQITGIAIQGQTGNLNAWTEWADLTIATENTWDLIRNYINANNSGFNITNSMTYSQVLALPYINDINIDVAPCMGCS
jgi:hypothetical protein